MDNFVGDRNNKLQLIQILMLVAKYVRFHTFTFTFTQLPLSAFSPLIKWFLLPFTFSLYPTVPSILVKMIRAYPNSS